MVLTHLIGHQRSFLALQGHLTASTGNHLRITRSLFSIPQGGALRCIFILLDWHTLLHYGSTHGRLSLEVLLCVIP